MERWVPIKESPRYEVSDTGFIRNSKTGRVLSPRKAGKGYQKVTLCDENGHHDKYIHRLVAEAYYDSIPDGQEVNHKDGNKRNNHISNLEICSRLDNVRHAISTGLATPYVGIPGKPVRIIETGETYASIRECARAINGERVCISRCLSGKAKTYRNCHFEYV